MIPTRTSRHGRRRPEPVSASGTWIVCPSRPRRPFSGGSRTGVASWRVRHRASASQHTSSIATVSISSNHSHPCRGHGAMHAPRARNPITHASETSGLNRVPTGRSAIRRANLVLASGPQCVAAAVASTSAKITARRALTPACFLSPAVMILPTSTPSFARLIRMPLTAALPPSPAPR